MTIASSRRALAAVVLPLFCFWLPGPAAAQADAEREYAYDRQLHIGKLDKALDEAKARNWTVVGMKDDWRTIFPSQQ